jgi:hypothetical protein
MLQPPLPCSPYSWKSVDLLSMSCNLTQNYSQLITTLQRHFTDHHFAKILNYQLRRICSLGLVHSQWVLLGCTCSMSSSRGITYIHRYNYEVIHPYILVNHYCTLVGLKLARSLSTLLLLSAFSATQCYLYPFYHSFDRIDLLVESITIAALPSPYRGRRRRRSLHHFTQMRLI